MPDPAPLDDEDVFAPVDAEIDVFDEDGHIRNCLICQEVELRRKLS